MRRERQFWQPPLDGSPTQSWAVGLALETKHVHIYSKETPAGTSVTSATSAVHRKGRGCLEWRCGFLEVRVCTQTCVSFTNRRQRVGISRTGALPAGAGLRHESPLSIFGCCPVCVVSQCQCQKEARAPSALPSSAFQCREEVIHFLIDTKSLCHLERALTEERANRS